MATKTEDLVASYIDKYPITFKQERSNQDPIRYEAALEVAKKAAVILKHSFNAERVIVFGSLTNQSAFTRWSDIDLAVYGVPDDRFYAAVGAITALTSDFKIDLVDISSCNISLNKAIEVEGIEL